MCKLCTAHIPSTAHSQIVVTCWTLLQVGIPMLALAGTELIKQQGLCELASICSAQRNWQARWRVRPRLGDGQALHKGVADRAVLLAHVLAPLRAGRCHLRKLDTAACGPLHKFSCSAQPCAALCRTGLRMQKLSRPPAGPPHRVQLFCTTLC